MTTFAKLGLNPTLQANIKRLGYTTPTEIQEKSIGAVLSGADTYAIAPTGTGKTAAYLLPTLQELSQVDNSDKQVRPLRALFLVPTRELALQVEASIAEFDTDLKLRTISVFGGVRITSQTKRFKRGTDILVATPKRLIDLLKEGVFSLSEVQHFVMDEADRLVSMGIVKELRTIMEALPAKRQLVIFSATDSNALAKYSETHQQHTKKITASKTQPAVNKILHTMYKCPRDKKSENLSTLLKMLNCDKALIFTRTKHDVNNLVAQLSEQGFSCQGIHNEIPQKKRQQSLAEFKNGDCKLLVATDIASRGIDIDQLYYVINYDLPVNSNDYIHRAGRTARTTPIVDPTQEAIEEKVAKQKLSVEVASTEMFGIVDAPDLKSKHIHGHVFSFVSPEQERLVPLIIKVVGKEIKLDAMPWY
ncbi:ATP-dependent helicase [Pseudoalteromonas citrea]|uniref:ATP-dependent helicase n=1 Tax=Pseudoalteromonas citrea TaxID=43655 RepID=A0A5S3XSL7_9GAMM|nr:MULTISPECIES: DEAD/DEAH box helicase [Pseudoalteromonas]RJE71008.1 DEAD/DEAH box helicase [Pseudoalteromonas sp. MSK9-3]TMP44731.1 ATP-dependent helicase [Pseudoalteromonas citrea]TMP61104.1 ATP-dependent helicase [Pseudoalteromonas citrea]